MGCWGRGCREKNSRGWYAVASAPEFDPNPGESGMGQIWVKTKNHPGAEKLWGGFLLSVLAKKQCWLHSNCRNGDGRCWRCPTKNERKPQVTKPGVFGKSTARGYNAPCFESVVHNFVGSILMRWDNEDRKDRLSIALAIQNETKHFQVVSSNFQVQY